jgi:predicted porin
LVTLSVDGADPFYPTTAGSSSILGNGSAPSTDNVTNLASFDRRQANSVHYWSPAWNGVSLRVTHGMNEEKPSNGAKPSLTSLAGIYESGPWYLTLAHERHHEYHGPRGDDQGTKIGVAYAVGPTRIAAVAERLAYRLVNGDLTRRAVFVSLSHQMGAHGLRATLTHAYDGEGPAGAVVGTIKSGPDTGATHITFGYEYALSKRTAAYAYYTCLDNDRNAVHDFAINGLTPRAGSTLKGSMLGLRHAF